MNENMNGFNPNEFQNNPQPKPNPKKKGNSKLAKKIGTGVIVVALGAAGGAGGTYLMNGFGATVVEKAVTSSSTTMTSTKDASSIASKMTKSVVAITTEEMTTSNFWYGSQVSSGAGSGVIMSSNGYIITCAHVVSGASSIKVTTSDNKTYTAKLVGSYTNGDIAVLKINATGLTAATFADSSSLTQGETTYAVGNPEGTFSDSITSGIISALNRTISVSLDDSSSSSSSQSGNSNFGQSTTSTSTVKLKVIQTDAAVSPGNSGGGLFNSKGELIGIVNAKSSDTDSEGLGFAIYGNTALKIAKSIISTGSYSG